MELLDIVDEHGKPTGKIIERTIAHQKGIRHRTSHVWIVRYKNNSLQVLLQKRSLQKDSYPGCYDISSAGHIPSGVDYISSAIRELKEELGYDAQKDQLIECGMRSFEFEDIFHGEIFHDLQVSKVFALWLDQDEKDFILQKEEVSEVKWFEFDDCVKQVKNNTFPHCIYLEELMILKRGISNFG